MKTTRTTFRQALIPALAISLLAGSVATSVSFAAGPGDGVTVRPMSTGRPDHQLIYEALFIGLEDLGYTIDELLTGAYPAIHLSVGNGDADFTAVHWDGLHRDYFDQSGGEDRLLRLGPLYEKAGQGYYIDRVTAKAHGISNLEQFKDPAIAALFDTDGDGKANLTGCNPGWGCEKVIEHHLDAYDLRAHINHDKGQYFALIANTITNLGDQKPIFYYTWSPNWVGAKLRSGDNTQILNVPHTSLPGQSDVDTTLPDGTNPGFGFNNNYVLANREFAESNPAAAEFLRRFRFPIPKLSAAMLRVQNGEKSPEQIKRISAEYVESIRSDYEGWLAAAIAAQ